MGETAREPRTVRRLLVRAGLFYLLLSSLLVGAWAQFAPEAFWVGFPGFGYAWVSVDGQYNEHLVRDVGGLQLAVAVLLISLAIAAGLLVAALRPDAVGDTSRKE